MIFVCPDWAVVLAPTLPFALVPALVVVPALAELVIVVPGSAQRVRGALSRFRAGVRLSWPPPVPLVGLISAPLSFRRLLTVSVAFLD